MEKVYKMLWKNKRNQRNINLDKDLVKANFKGFERLLTDKIKEQQKHQEESEEKY